MSEFKNYFLSFGIDDDEFTQMVFENIDVDGDGDISYIILKTIYTISR